MGGADEDGGGLGRGEGWGRKVDFQREYAPYVRKGEQLGTYASKGGGVEVVTPLEPRSPNGPVDPAGIIFLHLFILLYIKEYILYIQGYI